MSFRAVVQILPFLIFLLIAGTSEGSPSADQELLKSVEEKYQSSKTVTAKVEKSLFLKALSTKRESQGEVLIKSGGKLRLEFEEPHKSLIVMNGPDLISVQYPEDPEFDNKIRVLKSKRADRAQSQVVLTFLLGQGAFLEHFDVKKSGENGDFFTYELEPKKSSNEIKKLKIGVDRKNLIIHLLRYWDGLENETALTFSKVQFDKAIDDSIFEIKIPKDAEVTEL